MDTPTSQCDDNGRFAPGSAGGPGRPKGRGYELQRAGQDAISPEHFAAMMRRAMGMALEGNLQAMRFVAERACGKPPEAPSEGTPLDITMPKLATIQDCVAGIDRVNDAMVRGAITIEAAKALIDVIGIRVKGIEVRDLEALIADLERAAATVDLTRRN